jgi:transcriptional antiterminator RfaH
MRQLRSLEISHYGPLVARRYRSPSGRVRVSYEPLFANYVFMHGSEIERHTALTTNAVARWFAVPDAGVLVRDLKQIRRLIQTGQPLTVESRLQKGDLVRVRHGAFAGFEGVVVRRENETRLLVAVNFLQRGASVLLDDCQLEPLV